MADPFGSATLTSSFATIGTLPLRGGSWSHTANGGYVTVRLRHVKHSSQSGGYPVVRVQFLVTNAAGLEVAVMDYMFDHNMTVTNGVAAVDALTPEAAVRALTDSAGTVEYPLVVRVPPGMGKLRLQAKQAGDTTNFGTLAAELDGRI